MLYEEAIDLELDDLRAKVADAIKYLERTPAAAIVNREILARLRAEP